MINLKVQSRDGVIFEGDIISLSAKNSKGTFDILDQHENFISLVDDTLVIRTPTDTREIKVQNAILKIKENKLEVYVGINS